MEEARKGNGSPRFPFPPLPFEPNPSHSFRAVRKGEISPSDTYPSGPFLTTKNYTSS